MNKGVKIFLSVFVVFYLGYMYWYVVMSVAIQQLDDSNDIRLNGIMFSLRGEYNKSDSCEYIGQYLLKKSDDTRLLIPKPFRLERDKK